MKISFQQEFKFPSHPKNLNSFYVTSDLIKLIDSEKSLNIEAVSYIS